MKVLNSVIIQKLIVVNRACQCSGAADFARISASWVYLATRYTFSITRQLRLQRRTAVEPIRKADSCFGSNGFQGISAVHE